MKKRVACLNKHNVGSLHQLIAWKPVVECDADLSVNWYDGKAIGIKLKIRQDTISDKILLTV